MGLAPVAVASNSTPLSESEVTRVQDFASARTLGGGGARLGGRTKLAAAAEGNGCVCRSSAQTSLNGASKLLQTIPSCPREPHRMGLSVPWICNSCELGGVREDAFGEVVRGRQPPTLQVIQSPALASAKPSHPLRSQLQGAEGGRGSLDAAADGVARLQDGDAKSLFGVVWEVRGLGAPEVRVPGPRPIWCGRTGRAQRGGGDDRAALRAVHAVGHGCQLGCQSPWRPGPRQP